jgi:hypothetical protein
LIIIGLTSAVAPGHLYCHRGYPGIVPRRARAPRRLTFIMEQGEIVGNVTLFQETIRECVGAERKVIRECKSEDERIEALSETYGIELNREEREGFSTELRLT